MPANRSNSLSANAPTNLPTNIPFHTAMEASRPSVLSNVANATKRFFRFIIDKVERVVKRIFGKNTTGPSSIQKAIPVRTTSATNMLYNASLPLGGNKNVRAHLASVKDMLNIYPDAIAISFFNPKSALTLNHHNPYQELSPDNLAKCFNLDEFFGSKDFPFKHPKNISDIVDYMIGDIEKNKKDEFTNNEEIKIIIESPPFTTSRGNQLTDQGCAEAYITACEAWQLHLQTKYNKKVTILPFSHSKNYLTITENNNLAYDRANMKLSKMDKKDRETKLLEYINHITASHSNSIPIDNLGNSDDNEDSIFLPQNPPYITAYSPPTVPNIKRVLEAHKPDLQMFLNNVASNLEQAKTKGTLSNATDDFEKINSNQIDIDNNKDTVIDATTIHKHLHVELHNFESKTQPLNNARLSYIDENDNHFFLEQLNIAPSTTRQIENTMQRSWGLTLIDYQEIDEYAKDNNIDIGVAVIMYIRALEEHIFDLKKLDEYADRQSNVLKIDLQETLKIDTNTTQDIDIDFIINLNFPKEFLTALEQSKNSNISSLAQKYGSANLILEAIRA